MLPQAHAHDRNSFLSLSTAETNKVVVCGGLLLLIWLLLGKIGLVLVGVLSGAQLHSWWQRCGQPAASDAGRRQQLGIEVVHRLMTLQPSQRSETSETPPTGPSDVDKVVADYSDFQPAMAAALSAASDEVVEQYIEWWYRPIAPATTSFASKCRESLVRFVRSISLHLSRKRPADLFLHFLTNSSSMIIVFLGELSSVFGAEAGDSSLTDDSIQSYFTRHPESNLSNLLSTEKQQELLRLMANDILKMFLDTQLYKCDLTKTFLSETLCNLVLTPLVESCSRPEYINGWIIYLLEEGEPEIMNALDAGLEQAQAAKDQSATSSEKQGTPTINSPTTMQNPGHSHKKSRNEIEMEEAMRQVKRLNDMIAAENARCHPAPGLTADSPADDNKSASRFVERCVATPVSPGNENQNGFSAQCSDSAPSVGSLEHSLCNDNPSNELVTKGNAVFTPSQGDSLMKQGVDETQSPLLAPRTLRRAAISVVDDFNPNEDRTFRSKPTKEYLLQIEPTDLQHQGWMVARKYADFETLHEVLARISWVSGVSSFSTKYPDLPAWKGRSKQDLQNDLEHYLRHALQHDSLADSEAMKKFLDKSRGSEDSTSTTNFAFPNPAVFGTVSKGVLGVLANAPKGVAGGGKAVLSGVTGVFGTSGRKRSAVRASLPPQRPSDSSGVFNFTSSPLRRRSSESHKSMVFPAGERNDAGAERTSSATANLSEGASPNRLSQSNVVAYDRPNPTLADECDPSRKSATVQVRRSESLGGFQGAPLLSGSDSQDSLPNGRDDDTQKMDGAAVAPPKLPARAPQHRPLSNDEAMMAIELLFAVINEIYGLSSVWSIRKALLNAAKSFLLRPGNPNMDYIREIIQKSVDENIADDVLAGHINKLRQACLAPAGTSTPGDDQSSEESKERLQQRARELFVTKGMPPALASVMGTAATAEALGRVFDSLQVQSICQGLVFVIILQALKIVVQ